MLIRTVQGLGDVAPSVTGASIAPSPWDTTAPLPASDPFGQPTQPQTSSLWQSTINLNDAIFGGPNAPLGSQGPLTQGVNTVSSVISNLPSWNQIAGGALLIVGLIVALRLSKK